MKDTLEPRESLVSEAYWTPRETLKRRRDSVFPCHDSVSTERLSTIGQPQKKGEC
ncbi:unnamed protein product [Heligmosomoides polygyrus]|uniref:Addiction module toxin RelE n=1 Tax=Heligmosomoides polygyrus TaxID=6339 RepID=A0A183F8B6_HELPZ|nr:unnamed protein product [Heligmosomoides polygyrus]